MINNTGPELSTVQFKIEKQKLFIINNFLREIGVNKSEFFEFLAYHYIKTFFYKVSDEKFPESVAKLEEDYFNDSSPKMVHERLEKLYETR